MPVARQQQPDALALRLRASKRGGGMRRLHSCAEAGLIDHQGSGQRSGLYIFSTKSFIAR